MTLSESSRMKDLGFGVEEMKRTTQTLENTDSI